MDSSISGLQNVYLEKFDADDNANETSPGIIDWRHEGAYAKLIPKIWEQLNLKLKESGVLENNLRNADLSVKFVLNSERANRTTWNAKMSEKKTLLVTPFHGTASNETRYAFFSAFSPESSRKNNHDDEDVLEHQEFVDYCVNGILAAIRNTDQHIISTIELTTENLLNEVELFLENIKRKPPVHLNDLAGQVARIVMNCNGATLKKLAAFLKIALWADEDHDLFMYNVNQIDPLAHDKLKELLRR